VLNGLSPVIAASARWLVRAYPAAGGLDQALAERQAWQAVTIAAWLRYPTMLDAELVNLVGPGGSARLDWIAHADLRRAPVHGGGPGEAHEAGEVGDADGVGASGTPAAGEVDAGADEAWRTWVDEVVTSWAACLLTDMAVAIAAVVATARCEHAQEMPSDFRRLVAPDQHDRRAAALLRHPDLLAPVADLHRDDLLRQLRIGV
jgi:hypothetical protein